MSMRLNAGKATGITDQSVSFLTTSNGADPLTLKVGTFPGPTTLEPVDSWDSASNDVLEQVVETLFYYDLTDIDLPRINLLAYSYHWVDTTHLQIKLREGILFHDGTPFNAVAAKWNLDRLLFLTNCTGTNTGQVAHTQSLWMFPDGVTPIINNVATVGTYNLTITLNGAYAPFLSTLSYINAGMISPTAHAAEATSFIDLYTGKPIGTGPFKYEHYVPDIEVRFTRWDNYWKGPGNFEEMLFVFFSDTTTAHNAMLAHEIDILFLITQQNLFLYDADPNILVKRFTEDTGKPSLIYQYLGFNNQKYNQTWRKAMSHAINYTYVLEELREGSVIRANSPISPGFGEAFNESATAANFDIAKARTLMQSMGFGTGWDTTYLGPDEALWSAATFLSIPYTYNIGNSFREDLYVALQYWFDLIGINVVDDGVTWSDFLNYLFDDHDHLGIFTIGWGPDYIDPYTMLDPLFNPTSIANSGQVNDPWLNAQLALAVETTDETTRNNIYKDIQGYMAEVGYFHAYLYHNKLTYVHLKEIKGVSYNALNSFYAYPIYRATPGPFSLSSDAGNPDDDGTFTLTWSLADRADNYSVYQYSGYITEINGSLTLIADEIVDLSLLLSSYLDGTYYFIVAAINEHGYTLSNCINVVVLIPEDHDLEVNL
ncbi:MAG: ABC transporter substrate-binding protein, partial [Candidatus Heimdallarchaeota archaeon]